MAQSRTNVEPAVATCAKHSSRRVLTARGSRRSHRTFEKERVTLVLTFAARKSGTAWKMKHEKTKDASAFLRMRSAATGKASGEASGESSGQSAAFVDQVAHCSIRAFRAALQPNAPSEFDRSRSCAVAPRIWPGLEESTKSLQSMHVSA